MNLGSALSRDEDRPLVSCWHGRVMPCREINDGTETTAQATPNLLDLSNTEKHLVHGFEDVEGHLIGRVSVTPCVSIS